MNTTTRMSAVVGLCLISGSVFAQNAGNPDAQNTGRAADAVDQDGSADAEFTQAPSRFSYELSLMPSHVVSADFDDVGGEVGVTRVGGRFTASMAMPPKSRLSLSFGSEHSWYEFDGPVTLAPGTNEPFDHVSLYDVGLNFTTQIDDQWSLILGGAIQSGMEDGADFGDSLTYAGLIGTQYKASDSLTLGVGIAVSSRLEDNVRVIPVPLIEWKIDERWRLGTWDMGYEGMGYALTYAASDELTLGLAAGYQSRSFRLNEDGPVPDGVARDRSIPVGVVLAWKPSKQFDLRGFAGANFGAEYEVLDAGGSQVGEDQSDPALSFGISASFRF